MFFIALWCEIIWKTKVAPLWFKVTTAIHVSLALEQGRQSFRCKGLLELCVNFPYQAEHSLRVSIAACRTQHCPSMLCKRAKSYFSRWGPQPRDLSTLYLMSFSCHLQFHPPKAGTIQTLPSEIQHAHQHWAVKCRRKCSSVSFPPKSEIGKKLVSQP